MQKDFKQIPMNTTDIELSAQIDERSKLLYAKRKQQNTAHLLKKCELK